MASEQFLYDALPYPSLTFSQTHPDRFAVMGRFYGIPTAPPEKCRVLELGCSDGTNLNWLAYSLPDSDFIGVDLSRNHIEEANRHAQELKLKNVKFYQQDVAEMTVDDFGKFDYIFAHGLFSWVPDKVREKVLALYRNLLNPNGVGYISYNVYPGSYRRQIAWDMMRFYTKDIINPLEKVDKGVGFLQFITENSKSSPIHHEILKHEVEMMFNRRPSNIFHDDFAEENKPFYFSEFVAEIEKHGLQFLSEVENFTTQPRKISPEVEDILENISGNTVEYEQYLDFLESNRFRKTLICHREINLEREFNSKRIKDFLVSSALNPIVSATDFKSEDAGKFVSANGAKIEITHPLTKAALFYLSSIGTHPVEFEKIIENAVNFLKTNGINVEDKEQESDITASLFFHLYSADSIRFHTCRLRNLHTLNEKPLISEFGRWQLEKGNNVTTFYGLNLSLDDEFVKEVILLLDGTRTKNNLVEELSNRFYNNAQTIDRTTFTAQTETRLEQTLKQMLRVGLLI